MKNPIRIAVDIGGTFTDLQILNETDGRTYAHKTPTTPEDPSKGLLTAIIEAAERFAFGFDQVSGLMHGTTIATNAVLERKLPKGALITTAGFEDVLEISRHVRREVYSMRAEQRTVLIPRRYRFAVNERITASGEIATPLDEANITSIIESLHTEDIKAIAVCLLHAYANPEHERRLAQLIQAELTDIHISLSSIISPEIREFERSSTVVLNALLMPVVGEYLQRLRTRLADAGFNAPVYLVQSNGGVTTPETAAEQPARLLLSGPSGGALAAETLSRQLQQRNLIGADMGGTSFDVSVVHDGHIRLINQGEVADCPVRLPMVEMRTIGAGGGSIASVDEAGRLHVGPESAGALPGPVAYARGGDKPTVTDANVVLGRLDPGYFLGGSMALDTNSAQQALSEQVAKPLEMNLETAAEGVLQVATAKMAAAIRLSLFEKGLDPEDFALLAFGGAGGLHAVETAAELGARQVIFPRDPGTLSAWGMLFADINHDLARSNLTPATAGALPTLNRVITELHQEGLALLTQDKVAEDQRDYQLALDMRYPGQAYEILVPCSMLETECLINDSTLAQAIRIFHSLHHAQYAHSDENVIPEVVTVRLTAIGKLSKPIDRSYEFNGNGEAKTQRRLLLNNNWQDVPVFERDQLIPERSVAGPALIEENHSTLLLPSDWCLSIATTGDLIAEQI